MLVRPFLASPGSHAAGVGRADSDFGSCGGVPLRCWSCREQGPKRAVIFFGWVFFLISPGSPHVRPMGRTCGEPDEIELAAMGVELNGSCRERPRIGRRAWRVTRWCWPCRERPWMACRSASASCLPPRQPCRRHLPAGIQYGTHTRTHTHGAHRSNDGQPRARGRECHNHTRNTHEGGIYIQYPSASTTTYSQRRRRRTISGP